MNIFPTQYSLLSPVALAKHMEKSYGLVAATCKLLVHNVSDVYIVESNRIKYIFKVYRNSHRTLDEIEGEIELLNILKEQGARVSYPIKDLLGKHVQQFNAAEGIRHGVLFSFAVGKVSWDLDEEQLKTLGKEIASIHNISSSIQLKHGRPVYNNQTMLLQPLETIKPDFKDMPEEYTWLLKTAGRVIKKMNEFKTTDFSYGYCHYDLIPKNFHFDEQNQVTFFDFDFAGSGYLVNDLMTLYIQFFFTIQANKVTQKNADADFKIFTNAYKKEKPISEEEINSIPYLGFMFWVFFLEFYVKNFDDWSNTFLTPKFLKDRVVLIKKWVDWYCKF